MSIKHHFHGCQKAPLVRASLVKRRYIKYLALPFFLLHADISVDVLSAWSRPVTI